jgi:hypothetical protein
MVAENAIKLRELRYSFVKILLPLQFSASCKCLQVSASDVDLRVANPEVAPVPWSQFVTGTKEIADPTFDPHRQANRLV